jgi:hypothetical protein
MIRRFITVVLEGLPRIKRSLGWLPTAAPPTVDNLAWLRRRLQQPELREELFGRRQNPGWLYSVTPPPVPVTTGVIVRYMNRNQTISYQNRQQTISYQNRQQVIKRAQ